MTVAVLETVTKGQAISRGIAIGKVYFFSFDESLPPEEVIAENNLDVEVARYFAALKSVRQQLRKIQKSLEKDQVWEGVAILDAQLEMLSDPILTEEVEQQIRLRKINAESVFFQVVHRTREKFQSLEDPFFQERFKDIQDLSGRVMNRLCQKSVRSLADFPEGSIIFSKDLSASTAAEVDARAVAAFVTEEGGATSHAAIVAKGKGIPFVTGISIEVLKDADVVVVDGRIGQVICNPSPETLQRYLKEKERLKEHVTVLQQLKGLAAETYDGFKVRLKANIDGEMDVPSALASGGEGIGLLRSEYLFLHKSYFPTEEEQFQVYKSLVSKMGGKEVVIRTFDFGLDKMITHPRLPRDVNPYVGMRTLRYLLKEKTIFKAQLAAIYRASRYGAVSLLFPMVSSLVELKEAKEVAESVRKSLGIRKKIPIGCMIEVPSAAIVVDLLARECDFLSIGTNDLVQYSLAADRRNGFSGGHGLLSDPSILRLIQMIASEAARQGVSVTVCGEMAADPRFTPLLLGLGVYEFSCSPRMIPSVKNGVRSLSFVESCELAARALLLTSASEIERLLDSEYKKNVPDDCFYHF